MAANTSGNIFFYPNMAVMIARAYRGLGGRHAKQLALENGAVEGLIAVLTYAQNVERCIIAHSLFGMQFLGGELSLSLEHLTARDIKAWNRVETTAGARGLLSLTTLGRVAVQILALTSLRSFAMNESKETAMIGWKAEVHDSTSKSNFIDEVS